MCILHVLTMITLQVCYKVKKEENMPQCILEFVLFILGCRLVAKRLFSNVVLQRYSYVKKTTQIYVDTTVQYNVVAT